MSIGSSFSSASAPRAEVALRLREVLPGNNLYDLASRHGIAPLKNGKLNKGWVGQTIERVAGLSAGNAQRRDGIDFELKTTSLIPVGESWKPKETIKITQLTPSAVLEEEFETSVLWNKLASLILVGVYHEQENFCRVVQVSTVDITDPELISAIRDFWEDIRHTIGEGEMAEYTYLGTSRDYIQLRPTGDGKQGNLCPITGRRFPAQAFYGTKKLITRILAL